MKTTLLSLLCFSLLWASACSQLRKTADAQNKTDIKDSYRLLDQKWILTELAGKPVAGLINGKEPYLFLQSQDNRYSAQGGCNGLGGTFTVTENHQIQFSQGMSTMMACPNMEVEKGLKKILSDSVHYSIQGDILSFNDAKKFPIARFRAQTQAQAYQALNGTWEVSYVSGAEGSFEELYPDKKPSLSFNLPDSFAHGNSSCNTFRVGFSISDQAIQFKVPVSTKMYCGGNGEAAFFKQLKSVNQYGVSGNTLSLIKGDLVLIRLHKK